MTNFSTCTPDGSPPVRFFRHGTSCTEPASYSCPRTGSDHHGAERYLWRYSCTVIRSSSTDPTSIPCRRTAVSIPCSTRLSETGCISMTNPEDSSARIRYRSAVARQFSSKSTGISRRTSGFRSSNVCERNGTVSTSSTLSTVSRKRTPVTSWSSSRRSNGS